MTDTTLAEKRILIAGAGSGMGRATSRLLAAAGAHVFLTARSVADLEQVANEIRVEGGEVAFRATDVTDRNAVEALVNEAVLALGRIDVLISTVGTNIKERSLSQLTPDSWAAMVEINLTSAFNLTQAVVPIMRSQKNGLVIHVSSSAAKKPDPSGLAYQATKAGVAALAHATTEEERQHGIRASVVFPGLTDTPMVLKRPTPTPPEVLAKALQPEDVAAAIRFIVGLPDRAHVPELLLYPSGL